MTVAVFVLEGCITIPTSKHTTDAAQISFAARRGTKRSPHLADSALSLLGPLCPRGGVRELQGAQEVEGFFGGRLCLLF